MSSEVGDLLAGYRGRRTLITGGLGFIGSNLAHRLVELGGRVTIVDALVPDQGGNPYNVHEIADQILIRVADLRSEEVAREVVQGQEVIFNLAGQVSHVDSMENPRQDLESNILPHLSLLEACRRHNRQAVIVYAGTRGQYGRPQYLPVDESHPQRPLDINGVHKMAAEHYHFVYHHAYGLRICSLRLTNTYGPRMLMKHGRHGFISWFLRQAADDETIVVFGDGRQLRDFNYVDDVVGALLLAGASPAAEGQAFNLGSGQPVSVGQIAQMVVEACGRGRWDLVPYPEDRRPIEIGDYYADIKKASSILGWHPAVGLRQGLLETVRLFAAHRQHYWS
ncbi:MAG TPA: NAD-dependent epimerase/dehydratase family protein [Dehalococcoidia bacterium]|nr:NAD-dependent epimerase/dehydratase family protein [Dehalococcoidia bacterium]